MDRQDPPPLPAGEDTSMLESLGDGLASEQQRLIARHRVVLGPAGPRSAPVEEPDAIASTVPRIHLDAPSGKACDRKRILRLEEGETWAAYRLRCRDPDGEPETAPELTWYARPVRGLPVPVCHVHPESCTIRLFVALTGASFVEGAAGVNPPAFLARILLERPVEALLRQDGGVRVGREVPARLRALLALGRAAATEPWLAELGLLEQREPDSAPRPSYLIRRLAAFQQRIGEPGGTAECSPVTDAEVQQEISRLRKLVEARTLSALQLGEIEVRGVLNPFLGPLGDARSAVGFRLQLGPRPMGPRLTLWMAPGAGESGARPACLGKAVEVLHWFYAAGDIYGITDTVVNYVETNWVEIVRERAERCVLRRRLVRRCLAGRRRDGPAVPAAV